MTEKSLRLIDAVKQNLPAFLTASRAHQNERSLALLSDDEGIGGAITQLKTVTAISLNLTAKWVKRYACKTNIFIG